MPQCCFVTFESFMAN